MSNDIEMHGYGTHLRRERDELVAALREAESALAWMQGYCNLTEEPRQRLDHVLTVIRKALGE